MLNNSLSVYKISFKNSYQVVSDLDLDKISNLDIESSFDYKVGDSFYFYVITTKIEINKYIKILEKNLIAFTFEDLSDSIINYQHDLSYSKQYLDDENTYIYEIFMEDLNRWIYSKLDLDIVLDIISTKGIESLREVDKKFLKDNYETK
jgi:hypothetical protein